ncbi:hypothetical protein GE061_010412 [Apolygus lucorum]|uniref:Uncharacterized protein n=1 Tax=Apolygus lucorum TaxID=248454 RepID=A0A8S9Y5M9_APOLU|nr:hypothetical protein GE061_010412 [Apolygus lucorum]
MKTHKLLIDCITSIEDERLHFLLLPYRAFSRNIMEDSGEERRRKSVEGRYGQPINQSETELPASIEWK